MNYQQFLERKKQLRGEFGFSPVFMPDMLFDYQKHLVEWVLEKGRGAVFADTGLGKTAMQLVTAQNIVEKTNGNVLLVTPLAVSHQTVKEGEKFGIEAHRSRDGKVAGKITVTNYEQLSKFDSSDFDGVVCDESSIMKNFDGKTKTQLTRFMSQIKYRSLWTATPSPNDFTELGTSSEALGDLRYLEMISRFFRDTQNDKNPAWSTPKFVLKNHAKKDFWRWVSSWARAIKKPSDLGFNDDLHVLPELIMNEHILSCTKPLPGELFVRKAKTLSDQREERKMTLQQRCEKVCELVQNHETSILWCNYNYEADTIEDMLEGSVQISGKDKPEAKEEKFIAFTEGQISNLIIKPKIGAWGLNWQHCNHMTFFPSHSYEQFYQGIRRCYRFGQKRNVNVDIVTTEGEMGVYKNIQRKAREAQEMFEMLISHMNDSLKIDSTEYKESSIDLPNWI